MNRINHRKGPTRIASLFAAMAAFAISVSSYAAETKPAYMMTAYLDAAHGRKVVKGQYARAIDKITTSGARRANTFESKANLCVAYTKTGEFDSAKDVCDEALAKVRKRVGTKPAQQLPRIDRIDLAIALTNRGVLHALTGDFQQARAAFLEARELKARRSAVDSNLARLSYSDPADS